jgi:hypothetical protein
MKYWKLSLVIGGLAVTTTCLSSSSIAYMLNVPAKGKVIEDFILAGWVLGFEWSRSPCGVLA